MTETTWLVLTAVLSGAFGRIVKAVPSIPKSLLPWLVLLAGYGITFGLAMYGGADVKAAALGSWSGLAAGLVAVGGHEALKPALSKALGAELAGKVLGKLPAPKAKP